MTRQHVYYERGQPVLVITWWAGRGPRNVLVERGDGTRVVRPFRGLRRAAAGPGSALPPASASEGQTAGRDR